MSIRRIIRNVFGCGHRNITRPWKHKDIGVTYVVCWDCMRDIEYDLERMNTGKELQPHSLLRSERARHEQHIVGIASETARTRRCHVCKADGFDLTQYATNRYCHWDCGVAKWGANFVQQSYDGNATGLWATKDPKRPDEQFIINNTRPVTVHSTRLVNGEIIGPNDHHFE